VGLQKCRWGDRHDSHVGCDPAVAINFCVSVACLENGSGLFGQPPAGAVLIRTLGTGNEDTRICPESTTAALRAILTAGRDFITCKFAEGR
jgi:hypothetical protein